MSKSQIYLATSREPEPFQICWLNVTVWSTAVAITVAFWAATFVLLK